MSHHRSVWRAKWYLWAPAAVIAVVGMVLLLIYPMYARSAAGSPGARLERLSHEVEALAVRRVELDDALARADLNRARIEEFYEDWLGTEEERLTRVITEVKSLARNAGVEASSFGYPTEEFEDYDLVKRSIVFSVGGSYRSLRQFVNFLELSEQFLILEEIQVSESGDESTGLRVNMRVSTLFTRSEEPLSAVS